jgi:hypothetical protein
MKVTEALSRASDAITVKRVFAEPYEKEGLTVIAAAAVTGGAGAAPVPTHEDSKVRALASEPMHGQWGRT